MTKKSDPRWRYKSSGSELLMRLDDSKIDELEEELNVKNLDDSKIDELEEEQGVKNPDDSKKEKKVKIPIEDRNNLPIEGRKNLQQAIMSFIEHRNILDNPVRLKESKAACKPLIHSIQKLIPILENLDSTTVDRLCDITPPTNTAVQRFFAKSDLIVDELRSVLRSAELLKEKKLSAKDCHRPLKLSSLWNFIADLVPIYESLTDKKATATSSECTEFVSFVKKCIELIFDETVGDSFEDLKAIASNIFLSTPDPEDEEPEIISSSEYSFYNINNTASKVLNQLKFNKKLNEDRDKDDNLIKAQLENLKKLRKK